MPHVDTPQGACRFGIARGEITPPVGIYHRMWGAATHDRSEGVHRPLTATAAAFQPADGTSTGLALVLISLDLCLLWAAEMRGFLATVVERTGVPADRLVVTFSHTHGAGLMGLERSSLPGGELIGAYLSRVAETVSELVRQAIANIKAVNVVYGAGRCSLAAHRDFWDDATGEFACGFNPAGPTDDTVTLARFTDPAGSVVATVVNYACHPTTLAWQNRLISPDYPGAMRELVERETGAPCLFLQGASGDLGPREGFVGDVQVADRNGRELGYAALAALTALPQAGTIFTYTGPVVSGATLGTWAHSPVDAAAAGRHRTFHFRRWTVDLPFRADLPTTAQTTAEREQWLADEQQARNAGDAARARDSRAMVERMTRRLSRLKELPEGPSFPYPIALWRIGDGFWVAVEGEGYQFLQRELRARFPSVPIMVVTLAGGSRCSYLPTRETYGRAIYQEQIAMLAAGSLERLVDEIAQAVEGLG